MTRQKRESTYLPDVESAESEVEEPSCPDRKSESDEALKKMNDFLAYRDVSPVRHKLSVPWDSAHERTKRRYSLKQNKVFVKCWGLSLQAKVISYGVYWGITNHLSEARQM